MSKKKKRLDKKLIEERLRELETESKETKTKPTNVPQNHKVSIQKSKTPIQSQQLNESDALILRDVKKVSIVFLVMITIFVILFFLNSKTDYILRAGDKIISILHIGQL